MANTTDIFSQDFDAKALVADALKRGEQVEQETEWSQFAKDQMAAATGQAQASKEVFGWIKKLPKNLTVGAVNAGLSMAGLLNDLAQELSPLGALPKDAKAMSLMGPVNPKALAVPQSLLDPVVKWRDELTRNNDMSDDVTQGVAQFVVPFTAFAKAANVSKATSLMGKAAGLVGAEAATVGTAFDPHDMRFADLMELGREAENRFGEVMRKVSPDGSLLNSYINYMTDREDEGPWEGRFKNVVDSLGLTAATAGLLKAVPFSMKAARYAAENTGVGPSFGAKAAQRGQIGYQKPPSTAAQGRKVFRGVQPGVNPEEPRNRAGALFYAPNETDAAEYGPLLHEAAPKDVFDAGSIKQLLQRNKVDPSRAGNQDALMEALANYAQREDAAEWIKFSYPLEGNPEEFVRFPARAKKPYETAPDSLMGYKRDGAQTPYSESKYPKELTVRVTFPDGSSMVDGMRGTNTAHALERARRNWQGAEIELLAEEPYSDELAKRFAKEEK